jgi:hypothetical protein
MPVQAVAERKLSLMSATRSRLPARRVAVVLLLLLLTEMTGLARADNREKKRSPAPSKRSPPSIAVPPGCTLYVAGQKDTFLSVAVRFGSTPWQIARDNKLKSKELDQPIQPQQQLVVCPDAGRTPSNTTDCLATMKRPCAGLSGDAQKNCFCSYHGDGAWIWPFGREASTPPKTLIYCGEKCYKRLEQCQGSASVLEEPGLAANETGNALCFETEDGKPLVSYADRCTSHECLCSEYLLRDGIYQNPFDERGTTAVQCTGGAFTSLLTCEYGLKFDPSSGTCVQVPLLECPVKLDAEGCAIQYAQRDPCLDSRRKLLQSGQGPPRIATECNSNICCDREYKQWKFEVQTKLSCKCSTCADRGPRYARWIPITIGNPQKICACNYYGSCPFSLKKDCTLRLPCVVPQGQFRNAKVASFVNVCPNRG